MNALSSAPNADFAAKSRAGRTGRTWDHPSLLDSYSSINFVCSMRPLRLSNWYRGAFSLHGASTLRPGASARAVKSLRESAE
jgi:hypothetical protein